MNSKITQQPALLSEQKSPAQNRRTDAQSGFAEALNKPSRGLSNGENSTRTEARFESVSAFEKRSGLQQINGEDVDGNKHEEPRNLKTTLDELSKLPLHDKLKSGTTEEDDTQTSSDDDETAGNVPFIGQPETGHHDEKNRVKTAKGDYDLYKLLGVLSRSGERAEPASSDAHEARGTVEPVPHDENAAQVENADAPKDETKRDVSDIVSDLLALVGIKPRVEPVRTAGAPGINAEIQSDDSSIIAEAIDGPELDHPSTTGIKRQAGAPPPSGDGNARTETQREPAAGHETSDIETDGRDSVEKKAETRNTSTADRQQPSPAQTIATVAAQVESAQPRLTPAQTVSAAITTDPIWTSYFRDIPSAPKEIKSLHIQLRPVELGVVTASLIKSADSIRVEIEAQTPDARDHLKLETDAIVKSLRAVGVEVDQVTIKLAENPNASTDRGDSQAQRNFTGEAGPGSNREGQGRNTSQRQPETGNRGGELVADRNQTGQSDDRYI